MVITNEILRREGILGGIYLTVLSRLSPVRVRRVDDAACRKEASICDEDLKLIEGDYPSRHTLQQRFKDFNILFRDGRDLLRDPRCRDIVRELAGKVAPYLLKDRLEQERKVLEREGALAVFKYAEPMVSWTTFMGTPDPRPVLNRLGRRYFNNRLELGDDEILYCEDKVCSYKAIWHKVADVRNRS